MNSINRTLRKGIPFYLRVFRALANGARTSAEVRNAYESKSYAFHDALASMHALKLIHISGWLPIPGKNPSVMWAIGDGVDVPRPLGKNGKPVNKPLRKGKLNRDMIVFATFIRAIKDPQTTIEIVEATGMNKGTVGRLLKDAHNLKLARIADWSQRRSGCAPAPVREWQFAIDKPDAKRPPRMDKKLVWQRSDQATREKRRMLKITRALTFNSEAMR